MILVAKNTQTHRQREDVRKISQSSENVKREEEKLKNENATKEAVEKLNYKPRYLHICAIIISQKHSIPYHSWFTHKN